MASKPLYTVVAVVGIAAASGAAWWVQNKPAQGAATADGPAAATAAAPASGASAAAPRPAAVEVAKVETAKLVDDAQAVGSLRSRQSVMLRPEVSGRIAQINFKDGERVKRGQLLIQFDDELPRAQVAQARAELSIARANHKRNQELVAQGFISQRSVDESAAALEVAQAKLSLAQATAERLRVLAPFDGVTGIRVANIGDYLKDGTDIVNLEDMDAILVDFRLPERFQTKLRLGQVALVSVDALQGRKFPARVQAIDPLLDANGRSIGVRGCIDNRQQQLRPGMFARVSAVFGEKADARIVPEEAIVPQGGRQFVVKVVDGPDGKVSQRVEVKVGLRQPGKVEILEGVEPGDTVVTAGQQRLQKDGSPVRIVEGARAPGAGGPGAGGPGAGGPGAGGPGAGGPGAGGPGAPAPGAAAAAAKPGAGKPDPRLEGPNPCLALALAPAGAGGPGAAGARGTR